MTEDQKSLVHSTVKGTAWNYATFLLGKAVTFAATIVLARVLSPENFGLMSLALIAINYLDTFGELGVGSAVIYKQDNTEKNANVAFTLAMTVNILLAVIAFAIAPAVAAFFNEPQLTRIIQALSVTFILSGLGRIHEARLKKDMAFRKTVIPELAKTTAKAVVSIGMGLLGYGVWSLVWGQVAGSLVVSILYWHVLRWRPRLSLDLSTTRQLVNYSGQIVVSEILGMIQNNLDYLIIGKRLDSLRLGYYTMAFRVPELLIINLCYVISQALFPAYARLQDQPEALKKGFLLTLQYTSLFTVPVGVGLFFITPEFVQVVFSDRWLPAIPAMQALALYALVYSLSFNAGDIYKATGRPDILNKLSIVKLGIDHPCPVGSSRVWYLRGGARTAVGQPHPDAGSPGGHSTIIILAPGRPGCCAPARLHSHAGDGGWHISGPAGIIGHSPARAPDHHPHRRLAALRAGHPAGTPGIN